MEVQTDDGLLILSSDPQPADGQPETPIAAPGQEPGTPGESAPPPADDGEDKPVSGRAFQRFVDRNTRQTRELERELATARGHIDSLTKLLQPQGQDPPPSQPAGPPRRPRESDFATAQEFEEANDSYLDAAVEYRLRQRESSQVQETRARDIAAGEQEVIQASRSREAELLRSVPDYFDRIEDLKPRMAPQLLWGLQQAGALGPDLALHLHSHPDDLERLNKVPVHLIGIELGALRAQMPQRQQAPGTPPAQPQAGAPSPPPRLPEPPQPVAGSGASVTPGYRDDFTQEQYDNWAKRTYPGMLYTHRR